MEAAKKKYGLILKSKEKTEVCTTKLVAKPAVFGDDEEEEEVATSFNMASASVIRVQKAAEREHEKAEAEDPTIFDYDGNYDEIQAIKNEKKEEAKKADRNRESKYGECLIKAHARRQLEQFSREERQQQKEREKEGDSFADKEVFVTGAYRKQQEEVKKYREMEEEEAQFNELTGVQKQKLWEIGIGRTLLNDISRDPTAIIQRRKERKNTRVRMESKSPSPTREGEGKTKKSIYSDDEIDEKPVIRNFETELKPGLNRVSKKAETNAERIRQRNFTPTPPSSDDEMERRRGERGSKKDRLNEEGRRSQNEGNEDEDVKPEIKKLSLKEKLKSRKIDKETRMKGLKEILKQRNGAEEIEEIRKRYLERKESGVVVPPL